MCDMIYGIHDNKITVIVIVIVTFAQAKIK